MAATQGYQCSSERMRCAAWNCLFSPQFDKFQFIIHYMHQFGIEHEAWMTPKNSAHLCMRVLSELDKKRAKLESPWGGVTQFIVHSKTTRTVPVHVDAESDEESDSDNEVGENVLLSKSTHNEAAYQHDMQPSSESDEEECTPIAPPTPTMDIGLTDTL